MQKLVIIGGGNVAQHLAQAFHESADVKLVQVFTRSQPAKGSFPIGVDLIQDYEKMAEADLYLVAVSDNAISDVYASLPFEGRLVAHTSGMSSLVRNGRNRGAVFYPLQTFTKGKEIDLSNIPICIEAEDNADLQLLERIAGSLSQHVVRITSEQRKALHVAAVFANNFVNHLYLLGNRICTENGLPFGILKPLIDETANKVMQMNPADAQTGPAKRNDSSTINAHLDFLSDDRMKEIYSLLTQSIQDHVQKL